MVGSGKKIAARRERRETRRQRRRAADVHARRRIHGASIAIDVRSPRARHIAHVRIIINIIHVNVNGSVYKKTMTEKRAEEPRERTRRADRPEKRAQNAWAASDARALYPHPSSSWRGAGEASIAPPARDASGKCDR